VQPSELVKLALVVWIAAFVARHPHVVGTPRGMVPPLVVAGLLTFLVLVEDLGTAAIIALAVAAMLLVAGAPMRTLALVGAGTLAAGLLAVAAAPYRRERLLAFLDPWADPQGAGFQTVQAQIAMGSGGVSGVGLGDGMQKVFYLPEAHTDMIVATIGEELGLVAVVATIALLAVVSVCGFVIALRARDLHQQVMAVGLSALVAVQSVVNLGAVLGLLPVTGVPLPFVSYGGSSLVVFCAAAGLLVQIGARSRLAGLRVIPGQAEGGHRRGGDGRARHAGARAG
jgi:cell division protein FtsW